jgi:uncharacterized protein (TIGR03118 family)
MRLHFGTRTAALAVATLLTAGVAARSDDSRHDDTRHDEDGGRGAYALRRLVSDTGGATPDATLVNAWGIAFNPFGFVWVADNGSGKSTLYDGTGAKNPLVVTIPPSKSGGAAQGSPTGIVFSGGADFVVAKTTPGQNGAPATTVSGPARFIFASEDGVISGWAPNVDIGNARIAVDNGASGAVYKGLAIGGNGTTHVLYAADFHNGRVDMFDGSFKPISMPGAFVDPLLPRGYAPFGIQAIDGDIYVTYAKQDAAAHDEMAGPGQGYVDVYDPNGTLIRRVASRGALNAPWGLARAPASFGRFGGALLVANFGDGTINAYGPRSGRWLGVLRDQRGHRLQIDGLWGLAFGNGVLSQPTTTLFYTAGPNDEQHGEYGAIVATP